jgi:hypothetical protein
MQIMKWVGLSGNEYQVDMNFERYHHVILQYINSEFASRNSVKLHKTQKRRPAEKPVLDRNPGHPKYIRY